MAKRTIELLSPARDLDCGLAAINHGADAVYIGAPAFSARAAAANSLTDIEQLVRYAHKYFARVYVALNTLLLDSEIKKAEALIHQLYEAGVDALIIQDMGLLECDLAPIPLHASTQCDNRTVGKVQFFEQLGFEQLVLARELSLAEIREIRSRTSILLEAFIHGALCVSYSGRCYISEAVAGRSGNRGQCAQFCRHRYKLSDAEGNVLADEYVLSLKDFNLSRSLESLIDAGVSSLKIEGRLKPVQYVKNVTAYYRQALDNILERRSDLQSLASGKCSFSFTPNLSKSFNRGTTEYFLHQKKTALAAVRSPKSLGEPVGRVVGFKGRAIRLNSFEKLNNGDGCSFFDEKNELVGFTVNRVDGDLIYPAKSVKPLPAITLYRNVDVQFNRELERSQQCRKIALTLTLDYQDNALRLIIVDEDGICSETRLAQQYQAAKNPGKSARAAEKQLKKSGETIFTVKTVQVKLEPNMFVAVSSFNELRRSGFANHLLKRLSARPERRFLMPETVAVYPSDSSEFPDISNAFAERFYNKHGLDVSAGAGQKRPLMQCKYCVRAQYGICSGKGRKGNAEPLYITDKSRRYKLVFDCHNCQMTVEFAEK